MIMERVIDTIESTSEIDAAVEPAEAAVNTLIPEGPVRDALHGTWLGHRLHPLLVTLPIGLNVGVSLLDVLGGTESRRAATLLQGAALASAVPTAITGWADWSSIRPRQTQRLGIAHAAEVASALTLYSVSLGARLAGHHRTGAVFAGLGAVSLSAAGYLGGHLAYVNGVGNKAAPEGGVPTREVDRDRP